MILLLVGLNRISLEDKPAMIPLMLVLVTIPFIQVLETIKSMERLGTTPLSKMDLAHRPMMVDPVLIL